VEAIISSKKVFKVPKEKVGKFVVGKSDETAHFESKKSENNIESALNKFWAKINLKNSNEETIKVEQTELLKSQKNSGQKIGGHKRKSAEAKLSDDDDEDDEESASKTSIGIL